jgi:hypothetical protein
MENEITLIKKNEYLARSGMTEGEFRGKVQRNKLTRGVHYFIKDRATWIDVEAMEQWIRSEASGANITVSRSGITSVAGRSRTSSTRRGTKPTVPMRVVLGTN